MISHDKRPAFDTADRQRIAERFVEVVPPLMHGLRSALYLQEVDGGPSTFPQLRCLGTLAQGPRTLGEMADVHGVAPPTMSRLVDGLVERGWVARGQDPTDRRRVVLSLSPEGQAMRAEFMARGIQRLAELLADLAPEELAALDTALAGLGRLGCDAARPAGTRRARALSGGRS